jgi:hypothetical protein
VGTSAWEEKGWDEVLNLSAARDILAVNGQRSTVNPQLSPHSTSAEGLAPISNLYRLFI